VSEVKLEPAKHEPIILEEAPVPVHRQIVKEKVVVTTPKVVERKGKNGHPDYCQTTAYIMKETYKQTKLWLLQYGDGKDYSDLIEELLVAHLKKAQKAH